VREGKKKKVGEIEEMEYEFAVDIEDPPKTQIPQSKI